MQGRPNSKVDPSSHPQETSQKNFFGFFFLHCFAHFAKIAISHICGLKFGTHFGGLKTNTSVNFGVSSINIQGVISNFTHKAKLNFCQAYRVNHFEEQAENRYAARLNIRGVPFGG